MKKNQDVARARLRVRICFLICLICPAVSSADPASDPFLNTNSPFESLRLRLFPGVQNKAHQCKVINRGSSIKKFRTTDRQIADAIDLIMKAVQNKDGEALKQKFHPRLKVSSLYLTTILDQLAANYGGGDFDLNLYRVWALNVPNGENLPVECREDQLSLIPSFGYPLQVGVWLQARGDKELGRIYLNLVPKNNQWYIGVWHHQQWTHSGKDPDKWIEEALEDGDQNRKPLAFAKLDIAHKLLKSGKYLRLQKSLDAEATRATFSTEKAWRDLVQKGLGTEKVGYAGTAMAIDGVGILARIVVDPNLSTNDLRAKCAKAGKSLYQQSWTKGFGGFQCSFVAPSEDPSKEGRLGGYFYPRTTF